jgi:hypothetical protein
MKTQVFYAGAAAALLLTGSARAEDAQQPQPSDPRNGAAHAAMHEAMQAQMASPPGAAETIALACVDEGDDYRAAIVVAPR